MKKYYVENPGVSTFRSKDTSLHKISELIGKSEFKPERELNDLAIRLALAEITVLMKKNKLSIDFIGSYSERHQYRFITEEFMNKKISMPQSGSSLAFVYEEFHPDHMLGLKNRSVKFIHALFRRKTGALLWELDESPHGPDGKKCSKKKLSACIRNFFERYRCFKEYRYSITHIAFNLHESGGSGYTIGSVKFTALTARNVAVLYDGSFKLRFTLNDGWWSVQYFTFPGFDTGTELQNSE